MIIVGTLFCNHCWLLQIYGWASRRFLWNGRQHLHTLYLSLNFVLKRFSACPFWQALICCCISLRPCPLLLALFRFLFPPVWSQSIEACFPCIFLCLCMLEVYQSFLSWPTFLLLQKCNEICIMHRSKYWTSWTLVLTTCCESSCIFS